MLRTPYPVRMPEQAVEDLDDETYDRELAEFLRTAKVPFGSRENAELSGSTKRRRARCAAQRRSEEDQRTLAGIEQALDARRSARTMR